MEDIMVVTISIPPGITNSSNIASRIFDTVSCAPINTGTTKKLYILKFLKSVCSKVFLFFLNFNFHLGVIYEVCISLAQGQTYG